MSTLSTPELTSGNEKDPYPKDSEKLAMGERDVSLDEPSIDKGIDILALQDIDPALDAKMHIVNNVRCTKSANLFSQI